MIAALLAAGRESWESDLVRAASQAPGVSLVRRCVDVPDAVATAASGQVGVALLSLQLPGLDASVVERISECGVQAVAVAPPGHHDDTTLAYALGIRWVVSADRLDQLSDVVEEADHQQEPNGRPGALTPSGSSRTITVWGPTGAPGRSTVALGVASEVAHLGVPTLLVDADVYGGSIAQMLAILDEVSGVLAASRAANDGRLGAAELREHVRSVGPNLQVLTGIPRADRWPGLRTSALRTVLEVARELVAVVVVDVGFNLEVDESLSFDTQAPRRNGATLVALEQADRVVVVGSADPLGLTRLTRGVFDLRESVPGADAALVVNKVRPSLGWSRDQIADTVERFTGARPAGLLPLDQGAVDLAWSRGQTLAECAPDSALRKELAALARELAVPDAGAVTAPRRRLVRARAR